MKRTLLSLVAVLAAAITFAQTELLTNGGFEKWTGGQPDGWKSASTASSATLSQSNEAHSGSFAVLVGGATSNKRLASAEMKLKAGTYTFSIYMKAETADGATARIGYVPIVDGKVGSYSYSSTEKGANAPDTISNEWFKKTFTFKLDVKATVCLVVMNSKNYASKNVIVDDASLTTEDGGLDDEGGDDDPTAGAITISEAQAAASGTTCKVVGTVVAICKNGAVLGDDSGYIYYYKQSLSDLAIGDKVVLSGSTSEYGGFKQFTAAATVTKLGTETVTYPTPAELSLDAWLTQPAIQYVKLQGVLTISGNYYNLAVEGQEAVGSIVYPINSLTENLTSGSTVTVYGFVVYKSGSSTTYVNIVATKIDIDNMVVGKDIRNTPETAYTVTKARQLITEGEGLDYKVYVKGTVKGKPAIDTSFGNATYWIAGEAPTDGGKADTLEVYRGLYMNEEKFINEEALKEGDEVIVYGQLTDYQGTYEFTQGNFLYSINGATDKPQEKPVVTFADITIAEAAAWVVGKTSGIVYDNNKRLVLQRAEVVYSNGGAVFVREGENAVEFYNLGVTCSAGDVLSGEIRCSLENYYGIAEFIKCDSTDVTTVTVTKTGNTPVPVEVTLEDVKQLKHLCNLVVVKDVSVAVDTLGTFLKDGAGNKLQLRTRTPGIQAPEDFAGATYDVEGIPAYIYKGEGQLCATNFIKKGSSVDALRDDAADVAVYDLQGRRIRSAMLRKVDGKWSMVNGPKGLYIVGNRKMLVK